ncbi:LysR family transcriptional regulator [Paludibacterium purpuratum]|uniref:LysR family transcriptional regulator n=1 Tax=Paludibacterium purpuratum TaxID=1144873 RepID=A0A4R7BDD9_9NEIS|nr:LysR family transcriptional regulator [Paludibacterium purpuratum]TDR81985.1 LysR family transcriptional regulator [Paludibacterium purpuratum]
MNISLRQLRAFVAVARSGSFTQAAESLFVTQSALSGLIKELEGVLGLRLFDRTTRRIQLSDVGHSLFPRVDKILHELDGVLEEASSLRTLKTGSVSIAAPQLMAATFLPEVIAAFGRRHPGVRVRLLDCVVENIMTPVFSGEVDFAIGPERKLNSDIHAEMLFELPFMAVCPTDHPLAAANEVRWAELLAQPFISLSGEFTQRLSGELPAAFRDRTLEPGIEVTFMPTALSMVSAGLGVTACMPYAAAMVRHYNLSMRPLIEPRVTRRFFIYTRKERALSPAAQQLRAMLLDFLHSPVPPTVNPPSMRSVG